MNNNPNSKRGMVLVFTLVMLAILSALAINLSTKMNQEISLLQNSIDELKASALAKGGINYGIVILKADEKADEDLRVDWLGEDWAKQMELSFDDETVEVNIEDESGKINLNYLNSQNEKEKNLRIEQMLELCDNIGLEYSIINAIIDWIDDDSIVTVLPNVTAGENKGAENDYYVGLPLPYPCKNASLDITEEVLMVKGINEKNYYGEKGLGKFVTVFTNGKININTASAEVLKSTLQASTSSGIIDDTAVSAIMDRRIDKPFSNLSSELQECGISAEEAKEISSAGLFGVKSDTFTITSNAKVGKIEKKITALVKRTQSDIKVKFWKEQ